MIVGSVLEQISKEKRISITPEIIKKYISSGFKVVVEKGLGLHLGYADEAFEKEGCKIDTRENILKNSDIILQVNLPDKSLFQYFKENYFRYTKKLYYSDP